MLGKGEAPGFLSLPPPPPPPQESKLDLGMTASRPLVQAPAAGLRGRSAPLSVSQVSSFLSRSFYGFHRPNCLLFCTLNVLLFLSTEVLPVEYGKSKQANRK